MICEGQIVLFEFPQTDHVGSKLRPALVIRKLPGRYNDWLICMVSSHLTQSIQDIDVIIQENDSDFSMSGLKSASVVRVSRLAVVDQNVLLGIVGNISTERLSQVKQALSNWIGE